jgi:putative ABC transport system permease protein
MQFFMEAVLISITGDIIGVLFGITATKLVTMFYSLATLVTQSSLVVFFYVWLATGVFFGYYPALKASQL